MTIRARSRVVERMPQSFGRDLFVYLYGDWADGHNLIERHGHPVYILADMNVERRVFACAAREFRERIYDAGHQARRGTEWRLAQTALIEFQGGATRACSHCRGSGIARTTHGKACRKCHGRGVIVPTISWRSREAECEYSDFKRRLMPIYAGMLDLMRVALDKATRQYHTVALQMDSHSGLGSMVEVMPGEAKHPLV